MNATQPTGGVNCDSLVVRYGHLTAVDHVSFQAPAGEVIGLLGPNGAGKTSVIRARTTIIAPKAGTATVAGASIAEPISVRHRIGVLPESSGYPGSQRALEYLRFHGRLFGLGGSTARLRAIELLEEFGLGDRANSRIRTFSRGMRQRLGIARALINDPAVLFLDEPTLGLDPAGKEDILARIRTTSRERGTTVIVSSHLLEEAERVCDGVVIMHRGEVAAAGSVAEVVAQAGVGEQLRLRVAPADLPTAIDLLTRLSGVSSVEHDEPAVPGALRISTTESTGAENRVLGVLISADVAVRRFDISGGRLGDAFFALTDADQSVLDGHHAA
jgi:ABC-2 type transport system ATP-binding protein